MMQKTLLLALSMALSSSFAAAQKAEITPFVGYRFGGDLTNRANEATLDVQKSMVFGAIFDYALTDYVMVELHWSHQGSELDLTGQQRQEQFDVNIDNFHGGVLIQGGSPGIRPYALGTVGVTRFDIQAESVSPSTKFSFGFGAGLKGLFSEQIGYRVEFRGFTTFTDIEDEYEICDVFGCVTYAYSGTTFWQGQFMGGVTFAF
jgi:opacity protein-like surface antigen